MTQFDSPILFSKNPTHMLSLNSLLSQTNGFKKLNSRSKCVIFNNATVLDARGEKTKVSLGIENNKISFCTQRINKDHIKNKNVVHIDAKNYLITPGFWNGHGHLALSFLRSMGHGQKQMIESLFFKTEPLLNEKLVEALCASDLLTGLKTGTVGFVDHYYFHRGTAKAIDKLGLRGCVADTFLDEMGPFKGREPFENFKKSLGKWNFSDRIIPVVGPHATNTTSPKYFKELAEFARANKLKIHFHLSQTKSEFENSKKLWNCTPIEHLAKNKILGEDCLAVHVIHLGPNDLNILKSTGTAIGFCPTSQVIFEKLAPIESFLEKQLPILLGTDDAASNDLADMHAETKIAALISRHQGAATEGLAQRFFESATLATPRFFGIPSGLIEENYLADLLFYPMTIENSPRSHAFESFVFSMNANQLAASMIDGVWRLWNKKPLIEDTEELSHNYDKALRYLNNKIKTQKV